MDKTQERLTKVHTVLRCYQIFAQGLRVIEGSHLKSQIGRTSSLALLQHDEGNNNIIMRLCLRTGIARKTFGILFHSFLLADINVITLESIW